MPISASKVLEHFNRKGTRTILECMVDSFEEATLLRVQEDSLIGCDREEGRIKGSNVFFQIMSMSDIDLDRGSDT